MAGYPRAELRKRIKIISDFIWFVTVLANIAILAFMVSILVWGVLSYEDTRISRNIYEAPGYDFQNKCFWAAFPKGRW